jgi:hypothetical protein
MTISKDKFQTSIEINKNIFIKFKALCALKNLKMSEEIEKMIKKRLDEEGGLST